MLHKIKIFVYGIQTDSFYFRYSVAAYYFEIFIFAVVLLALNPSKIFVGTYLWLKNCEILGQYFGLTKIQTMFTF
jgi:hypothetical protein